MLARLRPTLDFMPSPVAERPGLLIRDPFQFSDATLIVPPALVACLEYFDGNHSELDLRSHLVQLTGELDVSGLVAHLTQALSVAGFLEDETFARLKSEAERAFAGAEVREPSHAGSAYPDEEAELTATLAGYMNGALQNDAGPQNGARPLAIAAPHVSPFGGVEAYRAAYASLSPEDAERTFVILGTSHYGEPDRFGLTRKPFVTPLGRAITDVALVDELAAAAPNAVRMEDYCHAVEHSIEFQVLFLQYLYGPDIHVLPILCGSFARSIHHGGKPEANEEVQRFFGALGNIAARESNRLFWVLGVDMAHMGRRYGDTLTARANDGEMLAVAERDQRRIERMNAADGAGFWELLQENQDDLKWCGSAPIYTFLKTVPQARGALRRYQQWNIDEQSIVSFAAVSFRA